MIGVRGAKGLLARAALLLAGLCSQSKPAAQGNYIKGASPSLSRKANKRACTG